MNFSEDEVRDTLLVEKNIGCRLFELLVGCSQLMLRLYIHFTIRTFIVVKYHFPTEKHFWKERRRKRLLNSYRWIFDTYRVSFVDKNDPEVVLVTIWRPDCLPMLFSLLLGISSFSIFCSSLCSAPPTSSVHIASLVIFLPLGAPNNKISVKSVTYLLRRYDTITIYWSAVQYENGFWH